jgi:hypothetical protein
LVHTRNYKPGTTSGRYRFIPGSQWKSRRNCQLTLQETYTSRRQTALLSR